MNIGIIGQGFVGNAVYQKFKSFYKIYKYDLKEELSNSSFNELTKNCNIIFVCLPTPMNKDGSCNIEIVREVLSKINNATKSIIINKSSVVPGTTEKFNKEFIWVRPKKHTHRINVHSRFSSLKYNKPLCYSFQNIKF